MPPCVCGCQHQCHRCVSMSVPLLPNPTPLYPMPEWSPINKSYTSATLVRDECQCGRCCEYLPNDGKD